MNLQSIQNEEGRHYVRTWIKALNIILNWPESRVLKWAEKWLEGLNNVDSLSMFYNRTPAYYLTSLMISDRLRNRLPSYEVAHLREQLLTAIDQNKSFCDEDPAFDWNLVRERVLAVLADYGETLPVSEAECQLWRV